MRAIVFDGTGGPQSVHHTDVPRPRPTPDEFLVRVYAAGLNRGDLLQRDGEYAVPPGQSAIPGVEIAGVIVECGSKAAGFRAGDRVFGVVEGGGFAEYCRLDAGMANPIPPGWDMVRAAATAEAWLTSDETLFTLGGLRAGQRLLVHAAASGIGTAAVRLAASCRAVVYATVGTPHKAAAVRALGATAVIDYKREDFVAAIAKLTDGSGVDVVLDFIGGARLASNLKVLTEGGCLVVAGLLDGLRAELDLLTVVERRLQIKGSSLRLRPMAEKRQVNARFRERWLARLGTGGLHPVVHAAYSWKEIDAALREMELNRAIGKIVIRVEDEP